jgi:Arylsulfotransferase (ASST)
VSGGPPAPPRRLIAEVQAGNGAETDLHEFNLAPRNTALITAQRKVQADLSAVGGPAKGWAISGVAQEIEIATGKVLFEWNSLDHVPLTESHQAFAGDQRRTVLRGDRTGRSGPRAGPVRDGADEQRLSPCTDAARQRRCRALTLTGHGAYAAPARAGYCAMALAGSRQAGGPTRRDRRC